MAIAGLVSYAEVRFIGKRQELWRKVEEEEAYKPYAAKMSPAMPGTRLIKR